MEPKKNFLHQSRDYDFIMKYYEFIMNFRRGCCSLLWNMPGSLHIQQPESGLASAYKTTVRAVKFLSREFHI